MVRAPSPPRCPPPRHGSAVSALPTGCGWAHARSAASSLSSRWPDHSYEPTVQNRALVPAFVPEGSAQLWNARVEDDAPIQAMFEHLAKG